jgi:hypothetical protein
VDVINTCSWERTGVVILPDELGTAGDLVRDAGGVAVPSQRLRDGRLAFLAAAVPGLGAKRYSVQPGRGPGKGNARVSGSEAGNGKITALVSPETGAVTSLRWKDGPVRELVSPDKNSGLGHYLYVPGTDPLAARTVSSVEVRPGETGPLVASIIVEGEAPGARRLTREIRVIEGLARVEITARLDKEKVRDKESIHFAFPFNIPDGTVRVDVGWGYVRPETDQIPGACRDFLSARNCVDISNAEYGLTWTSLDAPLVEIGAMTDETPGAGERRSWLQSIVPSSLLFSYALNNYWHTNYRADQEGLITLRYAIEPHCGSDTATAKKLGAEAVTPLLPVPADMAVPSPRFPLTVESGSFIATSLRPSADGRAWMLRLLNASDRPQRLRLSGEAFDRGRVALSDLGEAEIAKVNASFEVSGSGILTLRVSRER